MRHILLILFLAPLYLFGQEITFSEDFSIKQDVAYYMLDDFDGEMVLFRDIPRDRKFHLLDKNMLTIGTTQMEFKYKNPVIIDVVKVRDDEFSVIYTARKRGVKYLRIENFDKFGVLKDTLAIEDSSNLIDTPRYSIEKSEDESKVLFYDIHANRNITAIMVDVENLKVLWKTTFENLDIRQTFQINQFVIDNDGSFCLALLKDNSSIRRKEARFELHIYNEATGAMDMQSIPLEGNLNVSSIFKFDRLNNNLVGAGLYAEKNAIKAQGTYYLNVPLQNRADYTLNYTPFDEKFFREFLQKKNVSNNTGINATEVRDMILRRDGGVLLVGEKIETKGRQNINAAVDFGPGERSLRADYYFDQIFVASIHPTGKKHWTNIFQKKQYSFDDGGIYSSYFTFVGKKGVRLLFNDEIRSQSTISEFNINGKGDYKRRAIINTIGTDIKLRVRDALQISATDIVVPSQYRNKLKMVRFSF